MSRTADALQPKSDLHEQVAQIIWMEMAPESIVIDWEDAPDDDRRATLKAADWIINLVRTETLVGRN